VQTLLEHPRPTSVLPAPRRPEQSPRRAPARLGLTPALAEHPALLRTQLNELLAGGIRTLEVDVADVPVLPAGALHSLVEADATLRCRGGRIRLCNPTARSIRVLAGSKTLHLAAPLRWPTGSSSQ